MARPLLNQLFDDKGHLTPLASQAVRRAYRVIERGITEGCAQETITAAFQDIPDALRAYVLKHKNRNGDTLLHIAVTRHDLLHEADLIERMQHHGIALEQFDRLGRTPLDLSMRHVRTDAAMLLLEAGHDPNAANDVSGRTAVFWALTHGHEQHVTLLERYGARFDTRDGHKHPPILFACGNANVRMMMTDFSSRILLAAMVLELTPKLTDMPFWKSVPSAEVSRLVHNLQQSAMERLLVTNAPLGTETHTLEYILRPMRLAANWGNPRVDFPSNLNPIRSLRSWHSLFLGEAIYRDAQFSLKPLTMTSQLRVESVELGNAVGVSSYYPLQCCNDPFYRKGKVPGTTHLLSLKDANGMASATVECLVNTSPQHQDALLSTHIPNTKYTLHLVGIHGRQHVPITDGMAFRFVKRFFQAVGNGQFTLQTAQMGETEISRARLQHHSPVIQAIGYLPEWNQLEACHREYADTQRSEVTTGSRHDRPEYVRKQIAGLNNETLADARNHFIEGVACIPGSDSAHGAVALRALPLREWLYATGLREDVHALLRLAYPYNARQREATWRCEGDAIYERLRARNALTACTTDDNPKWSARIANENARPVPGRDR